MEPRGDRDASPPSFNSQTLVPLHLSPNKQEMLGESGCYRSEIIPQKYIYIYIYKIYITNIYTKIYTKHTKNTPFFFIIITLFVFYYISMINNNN